MFKHIQNRILFSYFLVLLTCFLIVLVTTSLFIRKTYFSYALNDLKDDAGLFIDEFTKDAIIRKDTNFLKKIVNKAEKDYVIEIFDREGTISVNSDGRDILGRQDFSQEEFKVVPSKGYGYAVREGRDGVKTVYVAISILEDDNQIGFVRISTPLLYIEKTINRLRFYVILIFILAMAISFLVSFFLSKGISSPLLEITKVAKNVSSGNLQNRVEIRKRGDEIGILVSAFNEMIERLKDFQEERKNILTNISHELMTPITSIRGFTEILYDGKVKDKEGIEECLEVIKKESNYLEALIEELRLISRIDVLSMKYDFKPLRIIDVVLDAEETLSVNVQEKNIKVDNDFMKDCPYINGDYNALRQVFVNLLDNAIKYSFVNQKIIVCIKKTGSFLKIVVKDHGIGIGVQDREKIFERFYRIEDESHTEKGIGLGLAIVREILHAHNATIKVESQINEGSQFIINFPVS